MFIYLFHRPTRHWFNESFFLPSFNSTPSTLFLSNHPTRYSFTERLSPFLSLSLSLASSSSSSSSSSTLVYSKPAFLSHHAARHSLSLSLVIIQFDTYSLKVCLLPSLTITRHLFTRRLSASLSHHPTRLSFIQRGKSETRRRGTYLYIVDCICLLQIAVILIRTVTQNTQGNRYEYLFLSREKCFQTLFFCSFFVVVVWGEQF